MNDGKAAGMDGVPANAINAERKTILYNSVL